MSTEVPARPLYTVPETAARLAVCEKTVRRLIDRDALPVIRLGHAVRIDPDQLEDWIGAKTGANPR